MGYVKVRKLCGKTCIFTKEASVSKKIHGWAIYCSEDDIRFVKKLHAFTSGNSPVICPATITLEVPDEGVTKYQDKHGRFVNGRQN